jgi:hypothetical protein
MMPRAARVLLIAIVAALPAAALAAEETAAPSTAGDQSLEQLKARVLAYWQARVKKDPQTEYDLLEPRLRARIPASEYGHGRTLEYLGAQVESVERRGQFARVGVRVLVKITIPPLPVPQRTVTAPERTEATLIQDHWVLVRGVWYRSQEADAGVPVPWPVATGGGAS